MSEAQIQSFERAGYKMSGFNKRQTEANYMKAERKVYTQEHVRNHFFRSHDTLLSIIGDRVMTRCH